MKSYGEKERPKNERREGQEGARETIEKREMYKLRTFWLSDCCPPPLVPSSFTGGEKQRKKENQSEEKEMRENSIIKNGSSHLSYLMFTISGNWVNVN